MSGHKREEEEDVFAMLGMMRIDDSPSPTPSLGSPSGFGDGLHAGESADTSHLGPDPMMWDEICRHLKPAEVPEVEAVIGSDIIARNKGLHAEAAAFASILKDFHSENRKLQHAIARRPKLGATTTHKMLAQQIQLLMGSLHERELPVATPRERAVLDFASGESTLTRTSSARRPLSARRRPGSAFTTHSAPDRLKPAVEKMNAYNVDTIAGELRAALAAEAAQLQDDISFLQSLLEEEQVVRKEATEAASAPSMPSVSDLRAFESKLQRAVSEKELTQRTDKLLRTAGSAPSSPMRKPKLRPLGSGSNLVPSPPTSKGKSKGKAESGRRPVRQGSTGSSRSLKGASKRKGKPPTAPGSPSGSGEGSLRRTGSGRTVVPPITLSLDMGAGSPVKKRRSRALKLRDQVHESRHL